jgi:hypothetical protein
MVETASKILASGRSLEADPLCAPVQEIFSCVGLDRISRGDRERSEALSAVRDGEKATAIRE